MSPRRSARTGGALALLAAALLSACGADPLSIVVLNARAPGDKCDFTDDTKYVSRGSLDFRPYGTGQVSSRYYQVFSWQNNLTSVPITVNGQVVDPGTGNDFIADSATYTYQYSDPSVALAPETANMHARRARAVLAHLKTARRRWLERAAVDMADAVSEDFRQW